MSHATPVLTIYRDRSGEWRWNLTVSGRITLDGAEGYRTRYGARRAALRAPENIKRARIVEKEPKA